jgi:hypothetical protein
MVCLRNISVDTLHKGDTEINNNNNNNNNNRFLFVSFFSLHSFLFYVTSLTKITPYLYFNRILRLHYCLANYATFAVIKHREINAVVRVDGKAYKRGESFHVLEVMQVIQVTCWGSCGQKSVFRELRVLLRLDRFSASNNFRVLAVSLSLFA